MTEDQASVHPGDIVRHTDGRIRQVMRVEGDKVFVLEGSHGYGTLMWRLTDITLVGHGATGVHWTQGGAGK